MWKKHQKWLILTEYGISHKCGKQSQKMYNAMYGKLLKLNYFSQTWKIRQRQIKETECGKMMTIIVCWHLYNKN